MYMYIFIIHNYTCYKSFNNEKYKNGYIKIETKYELYVHVYIYIYVYIYIHLYIYIYICMCAKKGTAWVKTK